MPELPEVQTIISDLNKKIKGEKIVRFWSDHKKAIRTPFDEFSRAVKNAKFLEFRRIGKNILADLDNGKTIYIHLKMTGHLLVKRANLSGFARSREARQFPKKNDYFNERVNQYIHHIFYLKSGKTLEFSDLRKFGRLNLVKTRDVLGLKEIKNLGVDPLEKDFTLKKLGSILLKSKKPIKIQLMEQEKIAGIGNIYASEILFDAEILPDKSPNFLKKDEILKLYNSIKKILKKAIKMRGTSDSDYRDTSGAPGSFHKVIKVYRRDGQECKKCGTIIERTKQGQRSTFYCPVCQK